MIDLPDNSIDSADNAVTHAANLLRHYSFELEAFTVEQQMDVWLSRYPEQWVLLAVVEALHQGRYKAVSVEQILQIWQRRGQPLCHFTHEFEQLVRSKIPAAIAPLPSSPEAQSEPLLQPTLSYRTMLLQLPSVKAAFKLKRLTEIPSLTFPVECETEKPEPSCKKLSLEHQAAGIAASSSTESNDNRAIAVITSELKSKPRLPGESDRELQQFKEGVIFALSSGLANRTLHPRFKLQLSQHYRLNWQYFLDQAPTEQFAPEADSPEFHDR
ncbi:hypothetical protein JOY44_17635 [Phormidium sp. CLA17]|uniref:hypothetical protein n=1 Tax=Leptolyngbya sp. Cla-17 TaxID=2803751 RepID=UPI0014922ECE|nr:hypothetical protein [Leptolyngbya sp. Cla-17]MBM0743411.1 hypothetical protein [Leptolyngbya sp. Cla-17]